MNRLAAIAASLLACQSALALTTQDMAGQGSVAVGHTTQGGMYVRLVDESGQYAAGVPYAFAIDPGCGSFSDGSTSFAGITDEYGFGSSPTTTGHVVTAACERTFVAEGLADAVSIPLFVFDPAQVVLTAIPSELIEVPLCRSWKFAVRARVGEVTVHPHVPLEVVITADPNGATASLLENNLPLLRLDGGSSVVVISSNDKQGRYELQARYGGGFVSVPIYQKKSKGSCLPF